MRREFSRKKSFWTVETILETLVFLLLFFVFAKSFIWGNKGFFYCRSLQEDIVADNKKINKLTKQVDNLKSEIVAWQDNDFMIEKVAREELQMALPGEKVYVLRQD